MSQIDKIATTIACYGNLYLSDQLDTDEWIIYANQFRDRAFQFYNSDGKLFANYLAQWLESQKKRGVKQFFLQNSELHNQNEDNEHCIYRNEFAIICQFVNKQETWISCYPKTIAMSSNLKLEHSDQYSNHHCRPISYILTKVETLQLEHRLPIDWQTLRTELTANLNQLWPINKNLFFLDNTYYYDHDSRDGYYDDVKEFPWHLPTLPPDSNLIIPHQLLLGLNQLKSSYDNDTNIKNESNAYYTLAKEDLDRFYRYGELINSSIQQVLLLSSQETRWQFCPDALNINYNSNILKTIATNQKVAQPQEEPAYNPEKQTKNKGGIIGIAVIVLVGYAFYNIIRYIFSNSYWIILPILFILYMLIK